MLELDRPEDALLADPKPACVALVPVVPTVEWSHAPDHLRVRADFVTQLIATAEQAPQTRPLRRATLADAMTAYRTGQCPIERAGFQMRQTA